ncbi:MAG: hypothetical protein JXR25_06055 [Pontiellaceae bacterium]|nr:hypothetical protein [Pontiellaceae bacterium]MBN2784371.1 hypothetical protein [Pontiellaceae bacterium]
MAKKKSVDRKARRFGLRRRLIAAGLVLLILYIGVQVISRTDGVRSVVIDKISNGTRLQVSLKRCGATPLLGFRLEELTLNGMEFPDVRLRFDWFSRFRKGAPFVREMRLDGAKVRFRRVPATGNWEPLVLHGFGQRLGSVVGLNPVRMAGSDPTPVFPPDVINAKTRLQLRKTRIMWLDEKGNELASIENADFSVRSEQLTKRRVIQSIVECDQVTLASRRVLDDFRLETVHVEGSEWITVLEMADRGGRYPEFSTSTLWQDLNLQLSRLSAVE